MKIPRLVVLSLMAIAVAMAFAASLRVVEAAARDSVSERLQRLEDREQIMELLAAYGTTLDRHDFAAFGHLFTEDAAYGGGAALTRGRAAIQAMLEKQITSNPANLPTPNSHLYFNPSIQVDGDHATAQSKGAYTAPDAASKSTQMVFFVSYEDTLVRRDGHWLFQQRVLKSGNPAAPAK